MQAPQSSPDLALQSSSPEPHHPSGPALFMQAESEGLVTVSLGLPDGGKELVEQLCEAYLAGNAEETSRQWDDLRRAIVKGGGGVPRSQSKLSFTRCI